MQGTLFKYGPASAHVAFKSPATAKHPRSPGQLHLVLLGGLTDGLLFAPYCEKLAAAAGDIGWSLVQAQLTSSYQGWGLSSLDQDAADLRLLSTCLAEQHDCTAWVLMGHSTGCQNAVRYVQRYRAEDKKLAGVILQAPVSDREYLSMFPSWAKLVQPAQAMQAAGQGDQVVCRAHDLDGAAVTARRLLSLTCPRGDDDMFSTDLTLLQLQGLLGPLHGLPCCILQSAADEAVPQTLRENGSTTELGQRMVRAIQLGAEQCSESSPDGGDGAAAAAAVELHVIEGAGHACAGHEDEVVQLVRQFLQQHPMNLES